MRELPLIECVELVEELKEAQWRVEIVGEDWYDGGAWEITIKGPLHDVVAKVICEGSILEALNKVISEMRHDVNGRNALYRYFMGKKLEKEAKEMRTIDGM